MTALHVTDIKNFMNLLFNGSSFDSFLFVEGDISTSVDYHISGRVNYSFYSEEELESLKLEEYQDWKTTKTIILQMIKGRRLPVSMKLVLKKNGREDITYYLNVRFENSNLLLVTGISRTGFSLDKSGEKEWDENAKGFLAKCGIEFEEMQ